MKKTAFALHISDNMDKYTSFSWCCSLDKCIWKDPVQHETNYSSQLLIPFTLSVPPCCFLPPCLQSSFLTLKASRWGHQTLVNSLYPSVAPLAPVPISPLKNTRAQHKNEQSNRVGSERETRASDNNLELNLWPVNRSAPDPRCQPLLLVLVLPRGHPSSSSTVVALHSEKRRSRARDKMLPHPKGVSAGFKHLPKPSKVSRFKGKKWI